MKDIQKLGRKDVNAIETDSHDAATIIDLKVAAP